MGVRGKIHQGVVVLEEGAALPEGSEVLVEPVEKKTWAHDNRYQPPEDDNDLDPLFRMDELAVDTGIDDLAENIDHYLYGHPRRNDNDV